MSHDTRKQPIRLILEKYCWTIVDLVFKTGYMEKQDMDADADADADADTDMDSEFTRMRIFNKHPYLVPKKKTYLKLVLLNRV